MARQRVKITPQKLRRLYYAENRTARDVALLLGCSPTTIKNYLIKYDFRIRRQSELMKGRKLTPEHKAKVIANLVQFQSDKV